MADKRKYRPVPDGLAPNPDAEPFCNMCCTHHVLPKCEVGASCLCRKK